MDTSSIALAIAVLQALPSLILASKEVVDLINSTVVSLKLMQSEHRDPSDAEWDAVNSIIATLTAKVES